MTPIEKAAHPSGAWGSTRMLSKYDGPLYRIRHPDYGEVDIFATRTQPPFDPVVIYDQSGNQHHAGPDGEKVKKGAKWSCT